MLGHRQGDRHVQVSQSPRSLVYLHSSDGGVDLNQDFPTAEDYQRFQQDFTYDPFAGRQVESQVQWGGSWRMVMPPSGHDEVVCEPTLGAGSRPPRRGRHGELPLGPAVTRQRPATPDGRPGYLPTHGRGLCDHSPGDGQQLVLPQVPGLLARLTLVPPCSVPGGLINRALWNSANRRRGAVGGSLGVSKTHPQINTFLG